MGARSRGAQRLQPARGGTSCEATDLAMHAFLPSGDQRSHPRDRRAPLLGGLSVGGLLRVFVQQWARPGHRRSSAAGNRTLVRNDVPQRHDAARRVSASNPVAAAAAAAPGVAGLVQAPRGHHPRVPGQGPDSALINHHTKGPCRPLAPNWPRGGHGVDKIAPAVVLVHVDRHHAGTPGAQRRNEGTRLDQPRPAGVHEQGRRFMPLSVLTFSRVQEMQSG
jgi:hypothetical protein